MINSDKKHLAFFPPVVTVLGHVDHGKTTLLDAIRNTDIAKKEVSGITQKIGASGIEIVSEGVKRKITFIDTPGHEAFSAMRSRGANVCDLALLVVSAADGVMPQTKESIKLLLDYKIPFIVVLTKIDLPNKNIRMVREQLSKSGVVLEGLGGNIPTIEVSAKTDFHIKELLDLILLVFDMHKEYSLASDENFQGVAIESYLDSKKGPAATVIVKKGTLSLRDEIIAEGVKGRVKALINERGVFLQTIGQGEAAEVLGFEDVIKVGSLVYKKGQTPESLGDKPQTNQSRVTASTEEAVVKIILSADTIGSLETITALLPSSIFILKEKTGEISEKDVMMAKGQGAIIIGFNAGLRKAVGKFALEEKVLIRNYTVIYELVDELKDVVEGKKLQEEERILGVSKVLAKFPFDKSFVLGISVGDGRIAKGDKVRLVRGEEIIGESNVVSVRKGKEIVSKVEKGGECGVLLSPFLDFSLGDVLISHA
ncbi:GTP-binding protein [Patescibacteria group bacterium]|nr:GTP-binding protein [Patescibacteria group bacterium]MCL5010020.1 GTP-binding protein [Patescibacteria group bacterium]